MKNWIGSQLSLAAVSGVLITVFSVNISGKTYTPKSVWWDVELWRSMFIIFVWKSEFLLIIQDAHVVDIDVGKVYVVTKRL